MQAYPLSSEIVDTHVEAFLDVLEEMGYDYEAGVSMANELGNKVVDAAKDREGWEDAPDIHGLY